MDADGAIASAITTLEAETLTPNFATFSYLSTNFYTKTTADSAIAAKVEEFRSEVLDSEGNLTGAFTNKVTEVLTGPDGAIVNEIASYGVEYGGDTYSIAEGIQVSVNLDGEYTKQWGVQSQVGDLQHGVGFVDVNGVTSFMVSVDNFAVFNPVDGEWEAIFGVTDGRVVIKEAVIGDAFLNTLAVQFSAVFENEVLVNGELTAWKLKGAQITGNALWMVNGNHSLAIEPDDFLAFWYGEAVYYNVETDTDSRSLGNAKFALTNTGEVIARGMELYDNDNNLIMDADGVDGVYIKDLSVDTLKIKGNAITVKSYYETSSVSVAGWEESFLYSSDHAHGGKESNGSLLVTVIIQSSLTSTAPGGGDLNFTAEILDSADDSVIQSQLRLGVKSTYVGVPEFTTMVLFAGSVDADNVYIRVKAESDRNSHLVAMRVVVDSAKR